MDVERANTLLTNWYSENQPTLFAKSENEILEVMSAIHVPGAQTSLNVDSIFHETQAGVSDVTERIDSVVKGCEFGTPIVPFYTSSFQGRGLVMHQMGRGCEGAIRRNLEPYTIQVLIELSKHPWEAKAVLTLSIFAWKYNSMCSNLMAILKQVPDSSNPAVVLNRQGRIVMLNNLVKANVQLIDHTLKLKSVSKDIPSLDSAMKHIPVYVFWSIISMMACATEIKRLASFAEKNCYGLNQFSEKINSIIKTLEIVQEQQAEKLGAQYISPRKMYRIMTTAASDSAKKFFNLIFHDKYHIHIVSHGVKLTENQEPRYIDIYKKLSRRYLFLFFTTMEITESDIEHLTNLEHGKKKAEENTVASQFKIIWIPVIQEEWTPEVETKYNDWKSQMDWYCVLYGNAHKKSIKKIKELGFDYKESMLTVIDPFGEVVEENAIQKLRDNKGRITAFTYLIPKTKKPGNPAKTKP